MSEAVEQIADAAYEAAEGEADSRDWGTSQEDINAYAAAAGAAAGAAACSAVGAAAAAPLCGWIAGEAAAWLADTIGGWFDSGEAEAAAQRREEVRYHFAGMLAAVEYDRLLGGAFMRALDRLGALHAELWPDATWEGHDPNHPQAEWRPAMLLLQLHGAPLETRTGEHVMLGFPSVRDYWAELDARGVSDAGKVSMCATRAGELQGQLRRAYQASVIALGALRAAELAVQTAAGQRRTVERIGAKYTAQDEQESAFADRYIESSAAELASRAGSSPVVPRNEQSWLRAAGAGAAAWSTAALVGFVVRRLVA